MGIFIIIFICFLLINIRNALTRAYEALADQKQDGINVRDFIIFMNEFQPHMSQLHALDAKFLLINSLLSQLTAVSSVFLRH